MMKNERLLREWVRYLLVEAETEAAKEAEELLNDKIGHLTEALTGLLVWDKITPADVNLTNRNNLVEAVNAAYGGAKPEALFAASWDHLANAQAHGQNALEYYISVSRELGVRLTDWLGRGGGDPLAPVTVTKVVWTGPGGGTIEGVGTADIVVEGTTEAGPYKQGYSVKASETAAKTLAGLGTETMFAGIPELKNLVVAGLPVPEPSTQAAKIFAQQAAAELLGGPDAVWPEGAISAYAGAAWLRRGEWEKWGKRGEIDVDLKNEDKFLELANKGGKDNLRKFGKDMWIKHVSRYQSSDIGKGLLSPKLAMWTAQHIAGIAEKQGQQILQNLYDHLAEGDVYTLDPKKIKTTNTAITTLKNALPPNPNPAKPTVHLSKSAGSTVFLCFEKYVLARFRPRVKDAGASMLVNFTLGGLRPDEECPTDTIEIFPGMSQYQDALKAYGPWSEDDNVSWPENLTTYRAMQRTFGSSTMSSGKIYSKDILTEYIREALLLEELTKSDKKEIERIAKKQAAVIIKRDALDQREIEKLATKKAEEAIKKALGVSFIGTKGDINKFVADNAEKGAEKWLKDKAGKQQVADVAKTIIKKLYKQLAVTSPQVIDRIKV